MAKKPLGFQVDRPAPIDRTNDDALRKELRSKRTPSAPRKGKKR